MKKLLSKDVNKLPFPSTDPATSRFSPTTLASLVIVVSANNFLKTARLSTQHWLNKDFTLFKVKSGFFVLMNSR